MTTQQPAAQEAEPAYTALDEVVELFDHLTPVQRESVRQLVRAMADPEGDE